MTTTKTRQRLLLPKHRVSYPKLITPARDDEGNETWEYTGFMPFGDRKTVLKPAMDLVVATVLEKWPSMGKYEEAIRNCKEIGGFKNAFRRGESHNLEKNPDYEGMITFAMRSKGRPVLPVKVTGKRADGKNQTANITEASEFYPGCYAQAMITCYAWQHKTGTKGVSFGLSSVIKVADGPRIGFGAADPDADFGEIEVEEFEVDNEDEFDDDEEV